MHARRIVKDKNEFRVHHSRARPEHMKCDSFLLIFNKEMVSFAVNLMLAQFLLDYFLGDTVFSQV